MREEQRALLEGVERAEHFQSDMQLRTQATKMAEMLRGARSACIFTGAGISTSAGIGDYRGKTGKWTQEDTGVEEEAKADGAADDDGVPYEQLRPTYTHEALSEVPAFVLDLGNKNKRKPEHEHTNNNSKTNQPTNQRCPQLMRRGLVQHIISQNCDGLHGLSGVPIDRLFEVASFSFVYLKCHSISNNNRSCTAMFTKNGATNASTCMCATITF
jgi:mono-ADP-ribosyltransferase sirtuin 6